MGYRREKTTDYKIIILDLDSTLTSRGKVITPRTKGALMNAQEAGNVAVLTSGQPTAGVELLVRELELSRFGNYILSYNGGVITNCETSETVFSSLLPRESNQKIIGLAEEHRVDILAYGGEEVITNNVEYPYAIAESNTNRLPLRQVGDMEFYVGFKVPKFLMLDDDGYLVTVEPKVKATMGRDFNVYRSELYFLEIVPKGIDKTRSPACLLEVLGLDREQMIACGDGYNDLTVIKHVDPGVAMRNAVLPIRQTTDYITTSDNHGGVGLVVERFMLS